MEKGQQLQQKVPVFLTGPMGQGVAREDLSVVQEDPDYIDYNKLLYFLNYSWSCR